MTEKQKYEFHKKAIDTAKVVKAYIKKDATFKSVSEETGIDGDRVKKLLQDREFVFMVCGDNASKVWNYISAKLEMSCHSKNDKESGSKRR